MIRRLPLLTLVFAVVGAAAFACSSPNEDTLQGDQFGSDPTSTSTTTTTRDGSTSAPTNGGGDDDAMDASVEAALVDTYVPPVTAQSLFAGLLPQFESTCGQNGNGCHASATSGAPGWLLGPDAYASVHTFDAMQTGMYKFITADILSSRFFTKGAHSGPAIDPSSSFGTGIKYWLQDEVDLQNALASVTTPPHVVTSGLNSIDLSSLGMGCAGTLLTFNATYPGNTLDLGNIQITAPSGLEIHIAQPQFIHVPQHDSGPTETDPDNQFSNVDQTTMGTSKVGPGLALFPSWTWTEGDALELQVKTLGTAMIPVDGGATTACSALSSFVTNVVPMLTQKNASTGGSVACLDCHNAGGSGNGALDMSNVGTNNAAACTQVYGKIVPKSPSTSEIINAPTGSLTHPIKLSNTSAFTTPVDLWINAEK